MTNIFRFNCVDYVPKTEYDACEKRLAEFEVMLRDLCVGHSDDCGCKYCLTVFRQPEAVIASRGVKGP